MPLGSTLRHDFVAFVFPPAVLGERRRHRRR